MPKILIFSPCDNVLVSGEHGSVSLIIVMTTITYPKPPEEILTAAANGPVMVVPMRWYVFCNWVLSPEDTEGDKRFEQRITLVGGENTPVLVESIMEMELHNVSLHHRMIAQMNGFPVVPEGIYNINLELREKGQEKWDAITSYPLAVVYSPGGTTEDTAPNA